MVLNKLEHSHKAAVELPIERVLFSNPVKPIQAIDLAQILLERFSNGFRINSPIDLARFRRFADENNKEIGLSDKELTEAIIACGIYFEKKVYVVLPKAKDKIKKHIDDYFNRGLKVLFYSEFYIKNEKWLFESNIVSDKMLKLVLVELFSELKFTLTYFGLTNISVSGAIKNEILHVWGQDTLLTYKQLAERLPYVPIKKIKNTLCRNNDFIWNSVKTFSHISKIKIAEEEQKNICNITKKTCDAQGFISISDLPIDTIFDCNYEISQTAVHNAIFHVCLSDKYDKKGKIIFQKGKSFDALSIIKKYCRTVEKCSLDDLLNLEKELTGEIHRWIPMEAGNSILVRVDKDTYVADKYVRFNIDKIDKAIRLFVKGSYLPLKSFTTFGIFPDCGQTWNLFLLESYCRRFSELYRFDTTSVNSMNVGAVIDKNCKMTYTEIVADAVASADIPLNAVAISSFLFDNGYTGKKTTAKASEIINIVRTIKGG